MNNNKDAIITEIEHAFESNRNIKEKITVTILAGEDRLNF